MRIKGKPVAFRWFISYIVILMIPLLLSVLIYSVSYRVINGQVSKIHGASMNQVQTEIDSQMGEMRTTMQQMAFNRDIQAATRIKNKPLPEDQLTFVNIFNDFQRLKLSYPYLDNIFAFLNETDTSVSNFGHMSQELVYHLYFQNPDMTLSEFKDYLQQPHKQDILKLQSTAGIEYFLLTQTTLSNDLSKPNTTLMLSLKTDVLKKSLEKTLWDDGIQIYIINEDNQIVLSTTDDALPTLNYNDFEEAQELMPLTIEGEKYSSLTRTSEVSSWKYVSLIPASLLETTATKIQRYTFIGLFICLLGGLAFSYWMTKQNYDPLSRIIHAFGESKQEISDGDEFVWLEKQVQEIITEQGDTQHRLWNNLKTLQRYYIYTFLEKPFDPVSGPADLERYQINLKPSENTHYVVVLFSTADIPQDRVLSEKDSDHISIVKFVILNIFQEIASEHFTVEMTDVGMNVAAIISLPTANQEYAEVLEGDIMNAQQKILEHFDISVSAAVGTAHAGMEGIYYSNLEATETLQYANLLEEQGVLYYNDIRHREKRYQYPIEVEQKLINYIRAGDKENATAMIKHVFSLNSAENGAPNNLIRYLSFDIFATLLKGAEQAGCTSCIDMQSVHLERVNLTELRGELLDTAATICDAVNQQEKEKPSTQLSEKVKEYVQENYHDPDLNISITGHHFDMTPAYLSSLFKEETGESLLEYINNVRTAKCKELLLQGHSVVEISEMTGFRSSGALIRVFKRKTGLTPGQYQKMHLEQ